MGTDIDFAFGARPGWKSSQGGANSEGSETVCQTNEIEIQPGVAQPSHSKDVMSTVQPIDYEEVCASKDVMSTTQSEVCKPSNSKDVMSTVQQIVYEEVSASKDVMSATQSEVCKGASKYGTMSNQSEECALRKNASKYVSECDSTGSVVIGESSTNQETEEMSCAKPKFSFNNSSVGYITVGGRVVQAQKFRNISYKGRGEGMPKPALSQYNLNIRRKSQQNVISDQSLRGENEGDSLTPTKRKLVQNCNTGTLRMIFEAKTDIQHSLGVVEEGGGAEVASPAKKRRCEPAQVVNNTRFRD
jgi:hypothetical protein